MGVVMRLAVLMCCALATGAGCQGVRFGRYALVCAPDNCQPSGGAPCAPIAPPCPPPVCQPAPPPPPAPEVKAPPPVRAAPPRQEVTETRVASTAVIQDILLIPRTVYVPYAPHVPVAPARLAVAAPAGRVVQTEERVREQVAAPPVVAPRETQVTEALDQCLQQMRMLNQRIAELETRAAAVAAPPAPCPAPPPPITYCPPAGYASPLPACPAPELGSPSQVPVAPLPEGSWLPLPRTIAPGTPAMPGPVPMIP